MRNPTAGRRTEEEGGMRRSVARGWPSAWAEVDSALAHRRRSERHGHCARGRRAIAHWAHPVGEGTLRPVDHSRWCALTFPAPSCACERARSGARVWVSLAAIFNPKATRRHTRSHTHATHSRAGVACNARMRWVQPRCSAERKQDGPRSRLMPRTPRNLARRRKCAPGPMNPL